MRRDLHTILSLTLLPFAGNLGATERETPNVVLILADDIGYGDLGWLGQKTIATPAIDSIANSGIKFTNCHATSATSTPSRYGLLTGAYPWRTPGTGVAPGDAAMIINPRQYSMADMFKSAGYTTAAVGKWHLGIGSERGKQDWNGTITPNLSDIGFDYSYIMAATADRVPCVFLENGRIDKLDSADPVEVSYTTPFPGEPIATDSPELLRVYPSHGHNMAIVDGIPRIGYMKGGKSALWHDEDIADTITSKAIDFICENQNNPFFLYFGTNDAHVPRMPHERFQGKSGMGPRGDALLSFDFSVSRIKQVLDSLGLTDNTILIITSDNGPILDDGYQDQAWEMLGNHRPWGKFRGTKYSSFEGATRVPLIVNWKRAVQGSSDALISQLDFMKSFAKLLRTEIPEDAAPDSEDLLDVLIGKNTIGRKSCVEQNVNNNLALLQGDWKLIPAFDGPSIEPFTHTPLGNSSHDQLFNIKEDPEEKQNLAEDFPGMVIEMKQQLQTIKLKKHALYHK